MDIINITFDGKHRHKRSLWVESVGVNNMFGGFLQIKLFRQLTVCILGHNNHSLIALCLSLLLFIIHCVAISGFIVFISIISLILIQIRWFLFIISTLSINIPVTQKTSTPAPRWISRIWNRASFRVASRAAPLSLC